jgi:phosphoribosyl-ATP pyrophosphohydrolase/phosphoribosyl-AMP cyclohydrolase
MAADCDRDTLLIKARPAGPVCHTGDDTCFGPYAEPDALSVLRELETVIESRRHMPHAESYVARLLASGVNKAAQKLGEEAVEVVIAAKDDDQEALTGEAADLMFHFLVLLHAKGLRLNDVARVLRERRK